jgi:hypothetical protein
MKIVSIDVGIKNLAICVLIVQQDNPVPVQIVKWDVINLTRRETPVCTGEAFGPVSPDVVPCVREVKYTKNAKYYCLKHSKKETYLKPSTELTEKFLKKQKVSSVRDIAEKHCIQYAPVTKKADIVQLLVDFADTNCFESVDKIDASKLDIVTIGRNIHYKLDVLFDHDLSDIDIVLIENQISPIAIRMKTIQGMLSQYFLMKNTELDVVYVSSMNKLKDDEVHNSYSERKKAGIRKCGDMITNAHPTWTDFFSSHKKKDDLADGFLQGMWYIDNRMKKIHVLDLQESQEEQESQEQSST